MSETLKRTRSTSWAFAVAAVAGMVHSHLAYAADTITVDCANVIRPATHCANGSLYGLTDTKPADINGLVAPLHPAVFRNPARGGSGNQHPYGAAIPSAQRVAATGAKISVDLADMLPNWPYKWPGMSSWLSQVNSFLSDVKTSGLTNWYGIEPWNEPDGTWDSANGDFNSTLWKQTYSAIRTSDPASKVVGPCYSYYNHNTMSTFLNYCKSNACLPDIVCWHELGGPGSVGKNVKDYRSLESSLGIAALPISINEYCDSNHDLEGQPGSLGEFIGKFERYQVDSAMISWWFTAAPGRLGSLLATDTAKGAGWYFMNWYGAMTGNMVSVSVANDGNTNMDGAVSVDADSKSISGIFGGGNSGAVDVTFKNVPAFVGTTAAVKVEKVDWTSKDTVCNGTTTVSTSNVTVSDGQLTVAMTGCNASSGYRISVAPDASSAGGTASTGGTSSAGGSAPTGGAVSTTGGTSAGGSRATGGSINAGGAVGTGGALPSGGVKAIGGSTATSTGGALGAGGTKGTGGFVATSAGGTTTGTRSYTATGGAFAIGGSTAAISGNTPIGGMRAAGGAVTGLTTTGVYGAVGGSLNAQDAGADDVSSCGCRTVGKPTNSAHLTLLGVFGLLAFRFKRRNQLRAKRG